MANHIDDNAETSENRSLDQNAIDEAIAAMQAEASKDDEVAAEEESNPESVGQEDVDAAIGAMQAVAAGEDETETVDDSDSETVDQKEIDNTFAAVQADADGQNDFSSESHPESEDGMTDSDDFGEPEPEALAPLTEPTEIDGESPLAESDNVVSVDDPPEDVIESELDSDQELPPADESSNEETAEQNGFVPEAAEPLPDLDSDNTFADLEEGDLENSEPAPETTEAEQLAAMTSSFDDEQDFSELDDEDSELAAAIASDEPKAEGATSSGYTEVLVDKKSNPQDTTERTNSDSGTVAVTAEKSGSRKKYVGIVIIGTIIIIGLAIIFGPDFYASWRNRPDEPAAQAAATVPVSSVPEPVAPPVKMSPQNPHQEKLQEVARLRADLLAKKDEIDQLKLFYRDGISELEEELQQEAARYQVRSFDQAIEHHQIELDLNSIQRRWAYIDELEKPSLWLHQGSEELLFLSRRAQIDLQMNEIAAGIELTRHTRHLNASMQKYQLSSERLAIDLNNNRLRPLKDIWGEIDAKNKAIAQHAIANGDRAIIAEICNGNTERIAELRTLTIKASKCLAQIESSELFLNQLTSISPVAAKYLSSWSGQWLCLNGFRELSPDVARHIFKWDGDWISLNGLEAFPPQIGEMLLSWKGRQLELMGLTGHAKRGNLIGLQQLADWEKSGGKLFVPENIRAEMDRLK